MIFEHNNGIAIVKKMLEAESRFFDFWPLGDQKLKMGPPHIALLTPHGVKNEKTKFCF